MTDKLRDMDQPNVLGYDLDRETLTPNRRPVDLRRSFLGHDHGADPRDDGSFQMIPSGDIVDLAERNRRLSHLHAT